MPQHGFLLCVGLVAVTTACSPPSTTQPSCGVPEPVAYTITRKLPLERESRDSAEFRLSISGTDLASGRAYVCVVARSAVVYVDSVWTSMWLPHAEDINRDSVVRAYAPHVLDGIRTFPEHPIPWGQGTPDPYGEWQSNDPYSALARRLGEEAPDSSVDTTEVIQAIQEFAEHGSVMLSYMVDPEAAKTVVWWPSRRMFVQLIL
jgi:hypothetical protein